MTHSEKNHGSGAEQVIPKASPISFASRDRTHIPKGCRREKPIFRGAFWGVAFWFSLLLVFTDLHLTVGTSETAICKWYFIELSAFGG